jgi:hypothetical protein
MDKVIKMPNGSFIRLNDIYLIKNIEDNKNSGTNFKVSTIQGKSYTMRFSDDENTTQYREYIIDMFEDHNILKSVDGEVTIVDKIISVIKLNDGFRVNFSDKLYTIFRGEGTDDIFYSVEYKLSNYYEILTMDIIDI